MFYIFMILDVINSNIPDSGWYSQMTFIKGLVHFQIKMSW